MDGRVSARPLEHHGRGCWLPWVGRWPLAEPEFVVKALCIPGVEGDVADAPDLRVAEEQAHDRRAEARAAEARRDHDVVDPGGLEAVAGRPGRRDDRAVRVARDDPGRRTELRMGDLVRGVPLEPV